jgi:hypothetical protein
MKRKRSFSQAATVKMQHIELIISFKAKRRPVPLLP